MARDRQADEFNADWLAGGERPDEATCRSCQAPLDPMRYRVAICTRCEAAELPTQAVAVVPISQPQVPQKPSSDPVTVPCPNCGKRLRITASLWLKKTRCPACKNIFRPNPIA